MLEATAREQPSNVGPRPVAIKKKYAGRIFNFTPRRDVGISSVMRALMGKGGGGGGTKPKEAEYFDSESVFCVLARRHNNACMLHAAFEFRTLAKTVGGWRTKSQELTSAYVLIKYFDGSDEKRRAGIMPKV